MTPQDILQWISQGVLAALLVYLAFRKAPSERSSLNGNAAKSYAEVARMAGEDRLKLEQEIDKIKLDYDRRIAILEHKKYRVLVEFEIADPPTVGSVRVEPIVEIPKDKQMRPKLKFS